MEQTQVAELATEVAHIAVEEQKVNESQETQAPVNSNEVKKAGAQRKRNHKNRHGKGKAAAAPHPQDMQAHAHQHQCSCDHHECEDDGYDAQEMLYLAGVAHAYNWYERWNLQYVHFLESDFAQIDPEQQALVPTYMQKLAKMKYCIKINQNFCSRIADTTKRMLLRGELKKHANKVPSEDHMEKVGGVLKQMVRDWSAEGESERAQCYGPLLNEIDEFFAGQDHSNIRILVPGAGLCRLPWELERRGYETVANEFTYFMLLGSEMVLRSTAVAQYLIFPYAAQTRNMYQESHQLKPVKVPDANPSAQCPGPRMKVVAGDWLQVFPPQTDAGQWDCIATCFFLDTAHNVMQYIKHISTLLKKGGLWVNIGPLLYHFGTQDQRSARLAKGAGEASIELTYDELKGTFAHYGLKLVKEQRNMKCYYCDIAQSMKHQYYDAVFFTCIKQ